MFAWKDEPAVDKFARAAAAAAVAAFTADQVTPPRRTHLPAGSTVDEHAGDDRSHDGAGGGERAVMSSSYEQGPASAVVIRRDLTRSWFNVWPPG